MLTATSSYSCIHIELVSICMYKILSQASGHSAYMIIVDYVYWICTITAYVPCGVCQKKKNPDGERETFYERYSGISLHASPGCAG